MYCCANCFGDAFLKNHIPKISKINGKCNYCASEDTPIISPSELFDNFQSICNIYTESISENAKPLQDWLGKDWQLFSNLNPEKIRTLLIKILEDEEVAVKNYIPRHIPEQEDVENWDSFRKEIKHGNRFFISHNLNLDRLKELFEFYLEVDHNIFEENLFRARIQTEGSPIPKEKMGIAPTHLAKNGRANPVGIPYLYVSSNYETAIAETRPHPDDLVSVAIFNVTAPLRLLNLQHPRETISPFIIDDDELEKLRNDLNFLCHLATELSKPILPRVADLEYLPTQYLCEFIKNCEFDGVVFKSSISSGSNVALFNDKKVELAEVNEYRVQNVQYAYEKFLRDATNSN